MKKNIFIKIIYMAFLAVVLQVGTSCSSSKNEIAKEAHKAAVRIEEVTASNFSEYIELNGNIEARNSVKVYPNIAGKISGTNVELGTEVHKGDVLLYIDPSTPGAQYSLSPVSAPISGNVITIPPKTGIKVSTENDVITIGDLSELLVKAYVPEKYFGMLKSGLRAEIKVEAYQDAVFMAKVTSVSPVVDETSRTVEVILVFDWKDSRITAGMYSKIKLYLKDFQNAVSVPEKALVERDGEKVVFVLDEEGKALSVSVETGVTVDNRVQIVSGIMEGQKLITEGLTSLMTGDEVSVIENR